VSIIGIIAVVHLEDVFFNCILIFNLLNSLSVDEVGVMILLLSIICVPLGHNITHNIMCRWRRKGGERQKTVTDPLGSKFWLVMKHETSSKRIT